MSRPRLVLCIPVRREYRLQQTDLTAWYVDELIRSDKSYDGHCELADEIHRLTYSELRELSER